MLRNNQEDDYMKPTITILILIATTPFASIASENSRTQTMPVAELKEIYLDCERRALAGFIGQADAQVCSVVYETLKDRAFDGSFSKLREWYLKQHVAPAPESRLGLSFAST
jgi:hypothetical protein